MSNTEVTLRQAHKYVKNLAAAIAQSPRHQTAQVSVWDENSVGQVVENARAETGVTFSNTVNMITAMAELRHTIDEVNHACGINRLMNKRQKLMELLNFYRSIHANSTTHANLPSTVQAAASAVAAHKERSAHTYVDANYITVYVGLPPAELKEFQASIVKHQRELDDVNEQLAHLNAAQKVQLSPSVVEALKTADLIG